MPCKLWNMLIHHPFIFKSALYPGQGCGRSLSYPGNTGRKARIHHVQDSASPSQYGICCISQYIKIITMQIYSCSSGNTSFGIKGAYITITLTCNQSSLWAYIFSLLRRMLQCTNLSAGTKPSIQFYCLSTTQVHIQSTYKMIAIHSLSYLFCSGSEGIVPCHSDSKAVLLKKERP